MLKIKLRSKTRKQERQPTSTADNDEANISKKSNKQKMKEYRQRLKENPDTYKTYLQSEAERNKIYRENLSEEKKAKQRELTRLRVQKYRENQKSQLSLNDTPDSQEKKEPKTPKTRQKVKEQREYWRKKKQDQRQIMTAQKKRRINEKRRQNYAILFIHTDQNTIFNCNFFSVSNKYLKSLTIFSVTFDDNQHTTDELAYDTGHIIVDVHTPLEVEPKEDVAQPSDISASTTGDKSIVDVSTNDASSNGPISVTFDNDKYTTNKLVDNTGTCDHLIAVEVLGPLEVEPKEDARQPADASAPTTGDQSIADVSTNDASGSGPISFTFDDNQHTTDVPAYDTGHNSVDAHTPLEVEPKEDVAQPPDVSAQTSGDQSIVEVSTNDASSNGPISVTFDDNQHITDGLAYDTGHIIVDVHTPLEVKPKEVVAQSPVVSAPTSGDQSIVDVSTNDASSNGPISYQLTGTYLLVAHGVNSFPAVVTDWPWVKFYSHQKRSTEWWIENEKEHIIIDEDVLQTLEAPTILMKGRRKYYSFRDLGTSGQ